MGKERLIERVGRGLKSAKEFVRTEPNAVISITGGGVGLSGLCLSVAELNPVLAGVNAVGATLSLVGGILVEQRAKHSNRPQFRTEKKP